jgi:hypothetical protein
MVKTTIFIFVVLVILANLLSSIALQKPLFFKLSSKDNPEMLSPYDWIKEEQISVFDDRVVIELEKVEWAAFSDTNSMDPLLDSGANALLIKPQTESEVHVGDIIAYSYSDSTIVHRVIKIGWGDDGWYAITKGDNNDLEDPERVKFSQVRYIVVGILY